MQKSCSCFLVASQGNINVVVLRAFSVMQKCSEGMEVVLPTIQGSHPQTGTYKSFPHCPPAPDWNPLEVKAFISRADLTSLETFFGKAPSSQPKVHRILRVRNNVLL